MTSRMDSRVSSGDASFRMKPLAPALTKHVRSRWCGRIPVTMIRVSGCLSRRVTIKRRLSWSYNRESSRTARALPSRTLPTASVALLDATRTLKPGRCLMRSATASRATTLSSTRTTEIVFVTVLAPGARDPQLDACDTHACLAWFRQQCQERLALWHLIVGDTKTGSVERPFLVTG